MRRPDAPEAPAALPAEADPAPRSVSHPFDRKTAAWYYLSRAMERASLGAITLERFHIVAQPVPNEPRMRRSGRLEIRQVARHDPITAQFPRTAAVNARRFDEGAICIAASKDGRFVGHIWLQPDRYDDDVLPAIYRLRPTGRCAWDFDVYIAPEARLGRAFAFLWDAAFEHLRAHGVQWTISRISAFIPESRAAHRRLGAVDLRTLTFIGGKAATLLVSSVGARLQARTRGRRFDIDIDMQGIPLPGATT